MIDKISRLQSLGSRFIDSLLFHAVTTFGHLTYAFSLKLRDSRRILRNLLNPADKNVSTEKFSEHQYVATSDSTTLFTHVFSIYKVSRRIFLMKKIVMKRNCSTALNRSISYQQIHQRLYFLSQICPEKLLLNRTFIPRLRYTENFLHDKGG